MAQDHDKAELVAELARARSNATVYALALRRDLDIPTRAQKAFKKSPLPWLGGAAVIGLIVSRLPRRKQKVVAVATKRKEPVVEEAGKAGLLLGVLKIAFDLARPALVKWATQSFADYMAKYAGAMQSRPARPRSPAG